MPPKRRAPKPTSMASRAKKPTKSQEGSSRAARLAKENDISIEEEAEIRETFRLFARTTPRRRRRRQRREEDEDDDEKDEDDDDDDDEYDDGQGQEDADEDGEGVMAIGDVRRALIALNLPPSSPSELQDILSTLDPDKSGFVPYAPFVSVCALKLEMRTTGDNPDANSSNDDEASAKQTEIEEAFRLFTGGGPGPITVAHLRRVARELHQLDDDDDDDDDGGGRVGQGGRKAVRAKKGKGKAKAGAAAAKVDDEMLRRMILEANGNAGVARGVKLEDFKAVMVRAGVF